jgi:hypothetical protein
MRALRSRITWPAVGGVIVTVAAFVYFYLVLNSGHIGAWSTSSDVGYSYHSAPSVRSTLAMASLVGLLATGIAVLMPAKRHQILATAVIAVAVFAAFALLVVPPMMGPSI